MRCKRRSCERWGRVVIVAALSMQAVNAAAATGGSAWATQWTVTSDYLFRGLSQTNHQPSLQAGLTYAPGEHFHAALWGSNVTWLQDSASPSTPISNRFEVDGDAGWKWLLGHTASIDVGLHRYVYPGRYPPGFADPDTTEAYLAVQSGDWKLTYWHALTSLFGIVDSRHSTYLDLSWARDVNAAWSLFAHVGRQQVHHAVSASYSDWNAGVTRQLGAHLALSLGYYGSNADALFYRNAYGHYLGRAEAVLAITAQW